MADWTWQRVPNVGVKELTRILNQRMPLLPPWVDQLVVGGHTHVEADITDLGNYAEKDVDETITGAWLFQGGEIGFERHTIVDTSGNEFAMYGEAKQTVATTGSATAIGGFAQTTHTTGTVAASRGAWFGSSWAGNGVITQAIGVEIYMGRDAGSGTVTTGQMLRLLSPYGGGVTNMVGIEIEAIDIGVNRYGIRLADVDGGTINRAIETGLGDILFGGYVTAGPETLVGFSPTFFRNNFLSEGSTGTPPNAGGVLSFIEQDVTTAGGPQALEGYAYVSHPTGSVQLGLAVAGNVEHDGAGTLVEGRAFTGGVGTGDLATGAITDAKVFHVQDGFNTGSGSIGTYYGLYVSSLTAGTNNYAIYTNEGDVFFGDFTKVEFTSSVSSGYPYAAQFNFTQDTANPQGPVAVGTYLLIDVASGTTGEVYAHDVGVDVIDGDITWGTALEVFFITRGAYADTVTEASGIYVLARRDGGTVTTLIGVDIASVTGATNNYALRTNAGQVLFRDQTRAVVTLSGDGYAIEGVLTVDNSAAGYVTALGGYTQTTHASGAIATVIGLDGGASHVGAGTVGSLVGLNVYAGLDSGATGNANNLVGVYISLYDSAAGASATTAVALDIPNVTAGATNNFAIRTKTGIVDLGDNVIFRGTLAPPSPQTYTPTNVTTDRSYDANSTTVAELADVLGTLIADLQTIGLIN